MIALAAGAKAVMAAFAMAGVQASILVFVALAITRAGKLRPAWQAAIWLVVLAKFALPWGPALPFSLADVIALVRGTTEASAPIVVGDPVAVGPIAPPSLAAAFGWIALASAWALGSIYFATRAIRASILAYRVAQRALPASPRLVALVAELSARLRVRAPRVVIGGAAIGPHVVGMFRPIVVIPAVRTMLDGELLRATLLHELAHVKRRDTIARVVQLVATSLLFFWPLVRLANRRLELAREAACDAWALDAGQLSRPAYARLLVQMARLAQSAPALAMGSSGASHLQHRVDAILAARTRRGVGAVHALGLIAWGILSLGGARPAAARPEPVCQYSSSMAEALRVAHPEADRDGDGVLSRIEACEFQAELRRLAGDEENVSRLSVSEHELLAEPLCCNCEPFQGQPLTTSAPTCQEGSDLP